MIHMSKKCVLAFLLTALLVMTSTAFAATGVVTPKALILRQEATTESKALQTLPQGTKLEIESKTANNWYKVTYGRFSGYVYASYVRVTENTSNETSTDDATLKKGVSSSEVKKLQLRLRELGFFKDSVATGYYGEVTVEAVKAFQKMNGLTADGVAGTKTLDKMNSSTAKNASGKVQGQAADNNKEEADDGTLKKGVTSSEVKKLQQRLKELGFFKDSVATGYYGDITVAAVKAFQKMNGLTADGVAGTKTVNKLNSSTAKDASGKVYGQATPTNTPAPSDGTLKKGVSSSEVKKLQQRLRDLGFFKNSVATGYYGDVTVEAVKAFQKMNGLTADGVAGTKTVNKLYSSTAKNASGKVPGQAAPTNTPAPSNGTLQKGSQGDEVKTLQQRLALLGYFTDSVATGYYGDVTVEAVKAFQKMNGLNQNGIVTAATLNKINADKAICADGKTADTLRTNQTLKKGDSNVQVKALQKRLKELGYYTGSVDGDYGLATATAVSDFQRANKLTVNGTANSTTLKKMVSVSAVTKAEADKMEQEAEPTYKTESLDWFEDGQGLFRRKTTLKVKDCRTGLVFTARVLYGTNHLDVEPLTAADTAILLKINGGVEFKHYRRPMLVLYNGHVYAASIYSEPHGDQSIYNNNFDGQFCLHFTGSMTHGTGVVDSDHQDCVRQALKYTW